MERFWYDIKQANLLVFKLRMGIEVAIKHLDERSKALNHTILKNFICQEIPVRRIWIYLKILKIFTRGEIETMEAMRDLTQWKCFDEGPEDVVVRSMSYLHHHLSSLS